MQGSFVNKRGITWTAYYYVAAADGKRRQRSKGGFATKQDARIYLHTTMAGLQSGEHVEPAKLTLAQYLEERWLPTIQLTVRPLTFTSYAQHLRCYVIPRLGGLPLQQLRADHLDLLYRELLKSGRVQHPPGGLSPVTIRLLHTVLHRALKDAARKRLVPRNVAKDADPPRQTQGAPATATWTVDELRSFLEATEQHWLGPAFLLAATTGMRRAEVLGLRWQDISFEEQRLVVRQIIIWVNHELSFGPPKTTRSRRTVALDPTSISMLKMHRVSQLSQRRLLTGSYQDNDLVFAKPDGSPVPPSSFTDIFKRIVLKLPVRRIRLHDLRHTHATLGLAAGVAPKVMADRLGHSSVAFTQNRYMHTTPELERDAASRLAGLLFPE
jgi:integrase